MARIRTKKLASSDDFKELLAKSAPERVADIEALWKRYDPKFAIAEDAADAYMVASKERIAFDCKTIAVYWLLSFAAGA